MQENIKPITIKMTERKAFKTEPIYQYDTGHTLAFEGFTLPEFFEVHFALSSSGESITQIGQNDVVELPDMYAQNGRTIFAWLFIDDGESGLTKFSIEIPVYRKARPSDEEPTPVEDRVVDQAIAALNQGVERSETAADNAEASEAAAEAAKDAAEAAADLATSQATAAAGSAQTAEDAARDADSSADSASASAQIATQKASEAAESAEDLAEAVATAQAAAQTATEKAGDATGAARDASRDATAAGRSATAAEASETAAAGSAATASTKATEADASATAAAQTKSAIDDEVTGFQAQLNDFSSAIQAKQDAPETAGTAGQVLSLNNNLDPVWTTPSGGGGTVDDALSDSSTNPVQNKVITKALDSVEDFVMQNVGGSKLIQQSDLVIENSNFVVSDGSVYAISITSPYNCMVINAAKMEFKYRRRSASYQLFIGVCINDHFVGNATNSVVTGLKEIYGTTNVAYSNVTVNTSAADNTYGTDYNDYTATLDGQVFELKKGTTTILKFTVNDGITIQGIAILNYYITYSSTTDNTDLKNCTVVVDKITEQINDAVNPVQALAAKADIIGGQSNHRAIAGAIRNSGNGWEFIVDTNHQADLNCVSVGVDQGTGKLNIDYSGINAKKVISLIVAPDETFANNGYMIGASVGKNLSVLQIFQYGLNAVSANIKFTNSDNGVAITVENSDGVTSAVWNDTYNTIDITHVAIANKVSSTAPIISVLPSVYGKYLMRVFSSSGTSTRFEVIDTTTGQKITSPNTGMSFNFGRIGTALTRNEIDPSTLVSANGNIWFMGIFET